MKICQHCGMYMKPIVNRTKKIASCEFCGETIARYSFTGEGFGKWQKVEPVPSQSNQ